ncbi:MAG: glycine zipper 2TM domain-containing protein [Emcibacter sp.]|nr:glycine zipper 2TM domain-containing protein [Emcibacter sp.]
MKNVKMALILTTALTLSACEEGSKQGFGTFLGAIAGAAVGSAIGDNGDGTTHFLAVTTGALAGAAIGNSIGKSLDDADRREMERNRQIALETYASGQTATWYNPDSGNSGTYRPKPAYQDEVGAYCREYQQTITIGGKTEEAYGRACRQPDGTWKIIS